MSIAENIAAIRRQIDEAARETGRTGADITLVGASKMNDAAACQEAIRAGIDALGENRVQEMTAKLPEHAYDGAPLHFIGHLQTNKIKKVLGRASLIQSVDSEHLLNAIEKEAAKAGIVQNVLLEVNIGGEESKTGVAPEALEALLHLAPERLVYISCNPATLARDARMLSADYELVQVTPLDLFPHSPHVESVSCWQRRA